VNVDRMALAAYIITVLAIDAGALALGGTAALGPAVASFAILGFVAWRALR
jgi:hypothetical protein